MQELQKPTADFNKVLVRRNRLRYRLHYNLRKEGFSLITKCRTIYLNNEEPIPESKNIKRLVTEFGYSVQLSL